MASLVMKVTRLQYRPIAANAPVRWPETRSLIRSYASRLLDYVDPGGTIGYTSGMVSDPVYRRQGATVGTYTRASRRDNAKYQKLERGLDYIRD